MIRTTTAFLLGAASVAALVPFRPVAGAPATDYEALPPESSVIAARIAASPLSLADAVAKAQAAVDGHARSATLRFEDEATRIDVEVFGEKASERVTVDGSTGEIVARETLRRIPGEPVSGEPTVTESGLQYYDLVEGDGDQATPDAMARFEVNGYLADGTLFDSSHAAGQSRLLPLDRTPAGFREGVGSMRIGGKRKLLIPYKLAYGEHGDPPRIPHRALIIYDVELLEILP